MNRKIEIESLVDVLEKDFKSCTRDLIRHFVLKNLGLFHVEDIQRFREEITRRVEPMIIREMRPYVLEGNSYIINNMLEQKQQQILEDAIEAADELPMEESR